MNIPQVNAAGWARAGRQAGDSFASIANTTRKYSPKYDEMAEVGIKARSQEKKAAIEAESLVRRSEIKSDALLDKTKIGIDRDKSINKSKGTIRKAGMVAAAGAAIGMAIMPDDEPEIRPEQLDYGTVEANIKANLEKDKAGLAGVLSKPVGGNVAPPASADTGGIAPKAPSAPIKGAKGKVVGGDSWGALSSVIRHAEGTSGDKGYTTMFGHRQFTDMSKHPNNPMATGWGTQSEAAGAYQFMKPTWDRAKSALGLKDFSRESQEKAGRFLATNVRGVDLSKRATNIQEFTALMDKVAPEWAGLPYSGKGRNGGGYGTSYYGQGGKSIEELWPIYQAN